jgi:hypothetical protein
MKENRAMAMPRHPDQDDDPTPTAKAPSRQTKVIIAVLVALVAAFIALHVAGVFGP